jgi:ABC-type lipoprotein export system ATPase subunit
VLLSFDRVTKRFQRRSREIVALDEATFEVAEGEFFTVMGSARSGKTTLLRLAAGMLLPDAGAVRFLGRATTALPRRELERMLRHEIGCVLENAGATLRREVVDFVAWPLLSAGVGYRPAAARAREALRRVGAEDCAGAQLCELAASELTRVSLAQALLREPRLLLADEPSKTLDPIERDAILALLRDVAASRVAVLMTAGDATRVSGTTHIASLDRGRLLVEPRHPAEVVELRRRPAR